MAATDPQVFALGAYTLDLSQSRLMSAKGDVALRPKAMRLLSVLAQGGGRVVSKDELLSEVWPDVFVTEDSLTQCVHEVREALGADHAGLLKTVPRRGYMLSGLDVVALTVPDPTSQVAPGTIAVVPFALPDGMDPQTRILFDGLAHDVISRLARLRAYRVTGRGSVFALRSFAGDALRLRQLLRVAYVAAGRVIAEPGREGAFRLVIDLLRTEDGSLEWVEDIPVTVAAMNEASAGIADRLVLAIALAVSEAEKGRALADPGTSPDAWGAFHRGLDRAFRFTPDDMRAALEHFRVATTLEPKFSRAHAFASFCHYHLAFTNRLGDRKSGAAVALASAERAIDADVLGPPAHWAYGRALWLSGNVESAIKHVKLAIELSPSFPNAHYMLGFLECHTGDPTLALESLDLSESLSPFDPFLPSIQITRAVAYMRLGEMETAADWAKRAAVHRLAYGHMLAHAALILQLAGRSEEARATFGLLRQREPDYDPSGMFQTFYTMPTEVETAFRNALPALLS